MDPSHDENESTIRGEPTPNVTSLSAELAKLSAYASAPDTTELPRHTTAAGGNEVLAAVPTTALYGTVTAAGMLTTAHPHAAVGMPHWHASQIISTTTRAGPHSMILDATAHIAQALLARYVAADPDDTRGLAPFALLTQA